MLTGYRVWKLVQVLSGSSPDNLDTDEGFALGSVVANDFVFLDPVFRGKSPPDRDASVNMGLFTAQRQRRKDRRARMRGHPVAAQSLGVYFSKDITSLYGRNDPSDPGVYSHYMNTIVSGRCGLFGIVIEHERGFRAQSFSVEALFVSSFMFNKNHIFGIRKTDHGSSVKKISGRYYRTFRGNHSFRLGRKVTPQDMVKAYSVRDVIRSLESRYQCEVHIYPSTSDFDTLRSYHEESE